MQRVMDALKPDAAMDERMGDLLLELADAIAVFLVQLPELVAKAAEGSVWTLGLN